MRRLALALGACLALAGCAVDATYAPPEEVAARAWVEPGPPTLTLMTVISNRDGRGGHSALMVSGSERVIFDPAGTWFHRTAPERGDVIHGITPTLLDFYVDYHARPAFHVVSQSVEIPPDLAERALALVAAHGPASRATCGLAVSGLLRELGFAQVERSLWPHRIMDDFDAVPGVVRVETFDDTPDPHIRSPRLVRIDDDGPIYE
jgi:hypothetical protein